MQHGTRSIEILLHDLRLQPISQSGALHYRAARRGIAAHEQRNTDDALIAHHGDLVGGTILHHVQQRDDGRRWKVHMAQRAAGFVKHLAERHVDPLELWQPALRFGIRQCGEQVVLRVQSCSSARERQRDSLSRSASSARLRVVMSTPVPQYPMKACASSYTGSPQME